MVAIVQMTPHEHLPLSDSQAAAQQLIVHCLGVWLYVATGHTKSGPSTAELNRVQQASNFRLCILVVVPGFGSQDPHVSAHGLQSKQQPARPSAPVPKQRAVLNENPACVQ